MSNPLENVAVAPSEAPLIQAAADGTEGTLTIERTVIKPKKDNPDSFYLQFVCSIEGEEIDHPVPTTYLFIANLSENVRQRANLRARLESFGISDELWAEAKNDAGENWDAVKGGSTDVLNGHTADVILSLKPNTYNGVTRDQQGVAKWL